MGLPPVRRALVAATLAGAALAVQAGEPSGDDAHGAVAESASRSSAAESVVESAGKRAAPADAEIDAEVARVLALSDDLAWGEYLAGECATCHGATPGDGSVPVIHGSDATGIARALLEYRHGTRTNTTMQSVAGALGDEEVAVLAHYLSAVSAP